MTVDALRRRVLEVIARGSETDISDDEFNDLALAVFAHQLSCNAPYRAYCEKLGLAVPGRVDHWTRIPAVPTDAFKAARLVCDAATEVRATFLTSGTTAGAERRGTHHFLDLSFYNEALARSFAAHLLPDGLRMPVLSLVPSPREQPHSSLSHMIGEVIERFGAETSGYFVAAPGAPLDAIRDAFSSAERSGTAVLVPGTSLAFTHLVELFEAAGDRYRLPPGSRVMDTGGFKGVSRHVTKGELYRRIEERLGVPTASIINEYGMTEMSSQFYDGRAGEAAPVDDRWYDAPGWVRTRAFDPETLEPAANGATGVLRHWDLANVDSVLALQTADLGVVTHEGFRLLGRARGAEARGCSMAMDELLEVLRRRGGDRG